MKKLFQIISIWLIQALFIAQAQALHEAFPVEGNFNYQDTLSAPLNMQTNQIKGAFIDLIGSFTGRKEKIINNALINVFFERDAQYYGGNFKSRILEFINSKNKLAGEVINSVDAMDKREITFEGKKILGNFNKEPVNQEWKPRLVARWQDFVRISTQGEYDMHQLVFNTLGTANILLQMPTENTSGLDVQKNIENVRKLFKNAYIILCAIAIEAEELEAGLEAYEQDLKSEDSEVRLQAAVVFAACGRKDDPLVRDIFRKSAVDEALTLAQRIKAAEYLTKEEINPIGYQIRRFKEHYDFIDKRSLEVLTQGSMPGRTIAEAEELIRGIENIDKRQADILIERLKKIDWEGAQLSKIVRGIEFFNGLWKQQLKEVLCLEHDFHQAQAEELMDKDVPDEIIFSSADYIWAAIFSQEVVQRLQRKNTVMLSGDREWFFLEAFKLVRQFSGYSMPDRGNSIKSILKNKWEKSTAINRNVNIFDNLNQMGLYRSNFKSAVTEEAVLAVANQFISRAYLDGDSVEFSPGPCLDKRAIAVGIEANPAEKNDAVHINHDTEWASKYIWAAYLALYEYIKPETFSKVIFDYYYSQLSSNTGNPNGIGRRISYIGIRLEDIKDLDEVLGIFIPLSIALEAYMDKENQSLAQIWRSFRLKFEDIVRAQNDEALNKEFFQQARMKRFVELVSKNNRDNEFFPQIKNLLVETLHDIDEQQKKDKEKPGYLESRLKPLKKNAVTLNEEVSIVFGQKRQGSTQAAVSKTQVLLKNDNTQERFLISLIPQRAPVAGIMKRYISIRGKKYWVFKESIRESGNHKNSFNYQKDKNQRYIVLNGRKYIETDKGLREESTGRNFLYMRQGFKHLISSSIDMGGRTYRISRDGITDALTRKKFYFKRDGQGKLIVDLKEITGNTQLANFFDFPKVIKKPDLPLSPMFLPQETILLGQSI
ncbi:MAG: hypothetical protein HY810_00280 [Candidatus Omnitrophica bacterium]|nr:hypothetical protein [Candidatus Omnitrophota bacterium]